MLLNYISYGIEFGFKTYFTFFERKTRDDFPSRMNQKIFSNFLDRNLVNDNKKLSKKKEKRILIKIITSAQSHYILPYLSTPYYPSSFSRN